MRTLEFDPYPIVISRPQQVGFRDDKGFRALKPNVDYDPSWTQKGQSIPKDTTFDVETKQWFQVSIVPWANLLSLFHHLENWMKLEDSVNQETRHELSVSRVFKCHTIWFETYQPEPKVRCQCWSMPISMSIWATTKKVYLRDMYWNGI